MFVLFFVTILLFLAVSKPIHQPDHAKVAANASALKAAHTKLKTKNSSKNGIIFTHTFPPKSNPTHHGLMSENEDNFAVQPILSETISKNTTITLGSHSLPIPPSSPNLNPIGTKLAISNLRQELSAVLFADLPPTLGSSSPKAKISLSLSKSNNRAKSSTPNSPKKLYTKPNSLSRGVSPARDAICEKSTVLDNIVPEEIFGNECLPQNDEETQEELADRHSLRLSDHSLDLPETQDMNQYDLNDFLDAYETSFSGSSVTEVVADSAVVVANDPRFSTYPRSPRRSLSPRTSVGSQSSGSPLLTKTLKHRFHSKVRVAVQRRSSLSGDEIVPVAAVQNPFLRSSRLSVETEKFENCNKELRLPTLEESVAEIEISQGDDNNEDALIGLTKILNSSAPCILLSIYAFGISLIVLFALWYLETGSTIQFCSDEVISSTQTSEILTGQDLMMYLMPSCIPCPASAICQSDLILGCSKDGQDTFFAESMSLKSAFLISTICRETSLPAPVPTEKPRKRQRDVIDQAAALARNTSMRISQDIMAYSVTLFHIAREIAHKVHLGSKNGFEIVRVHLSKKAIRAIELKGYVFNKHNNAISYCATVAMMNFDAIVYYVTSIATVGSPILLLFWCIWSYVKKMVRAKRDSDFGIATEAAELVIRKLQERAARIRRHSLVLSKSMDTSVRLDQVKDLVLSSNPKLQRRISRGGDVDENIGFFLLDEKRRGEIWDITRKIVLNSGAVEEMEVDGVALWMCV
ncbi:hypothetical protein HK100_012775 [Physocladia obscura]|uniref:Man1/Src1-like C-terminal domain-containing protein n=1 Tax=Physocladia obscura TaxID=109957 RepID=A0AAD5T118_9FUNG|nr:hypothetical protein HK100_012775 [Physocladia obscura]